MGRAVEIVIEFTGFERPRRIEETVHMSSMDLQGGMTFDPVAGGTRMRWSWALEPHGGLRLMSPMITSMGRRSEQTIWGGLKRLLEAPDTSVSSAGT